jgi:NMD protein affecting ribosome stability and mRNA decay
MQKFCPECGVPTSGGLCDACNNEDPLELSARLKLCPSKRYFYDGGWKSFDSPDEVYDHIARKKKLDAIHSVDKNVDVLRQKSGLDTEVRINGEKDGDPVIVVVETQVRPSPQRRKLDGAYFEAVLQIRHTDQDVLKRVDSLLREGARSSAQVNKIVEKQDGVDLFIVHKRDVGFFVDALLDDFGGVVKRNRSLHTEDKMTSKRVYRDKVLLRLPRFRVNDVIEINEDVFHVKRVGKKVEGYSLKRGKHTVHWLEEKHMRIKPLERNRVVVTNVGDAVEALHPETYENVTYTNPYGYELVPGQKVSVVLTDSDRFVVKD